MWLQTASAARSISDLIIFVATSATHLAEVRRGESIKSLSVLGVRDSAQEYVALPDTKLVKYILPLASYIIKHACSNQLHHYYTLGSEGYDGHTDHIATHTAALVAQRLLAEKHPLTLWSLAPHSGEWDVRQNARTVPKLAALALHGSQMPLKRTFSGNLRITDRSHWQAFVGVYGSVLFDAEHYRRLGV